MANPSNISKQSAESLIYTLDASNSVDSGDSIASIQCKMFDSSATDVTSTMISGTPSFSGTDITVQIMAGSDGNDYNLRVRITTTNGELIEDDVLVQVKDFSI